MSEATGRVCAFERSWPLTGGIKIVVQNAKEVCIKNICQMIESLALRARLNLLTMFSNCAVPSALRGHTRFYPGFRTSSITVTSGGERNLTGGPQVPVPRLTRRTDPPGRSNLPAVIGYAIWATYRNG